MNWVGPANPQWIDGRRDHPLYYRWWRMILRCSNPSDRQWSDYGGRGITVCKQWRDDFWAYVHDLGDCPGPEYTVDRIDNDGNYEPGNVRWATRIEQNQNKRRYRVRTHCNRGHLFDERNTYVNPTTGKRGCRKCLAALHRKYRRERKAA